MEIKYYTKEDALIAIKKDVKEFDYASLSVKIEIAEDLEAVFAIRDSIRDKYNKKNTELVAYSTDEVLDGYAKNYKEAVDSLSFLSKRVADALDISYKDKNDRKQQNHSI